MIDLEIFALAAGVILCAALQFGLQNFSPMSLQGQNDERMTLKASAYAAHFFAEPLFFE
jgi:hypothetical protein